MQSFSFKVICVFVLMLGPLVNSNCPGADGMLLGEIRDADTGERLPARLYIQSGNRWFFARSAAKNGTAVVYNKQRGNGPSIERHTTLSAHPFVADLPPGRYTVTVERGKEYLPEVQKVVIGDEPVRVSVKLQRWIDLAALGWYSGDTHNHRRLDELPNIMLAEDLNVGLPLTGWVREAYVTPEKSYALETGRIETKLMKLDATHVIYPLNTEWEIFSVDKKRHTLGAIFALGHKKPFRVGAPPVSAITAEARQQGSLLELDKHNWPWSMMLVPIMDVDLFELTNNHVWRTKFYFKQFNHQYAAEYMNLELDESGGFTEWGWLDFGFQNYYALLNCGFRMRVTAGTASGVHPVPLGFGRVYVHLPDGFGYEKWMNGLNRGQSFVTTDPMLFVKANGKLPGHIFSQDKESECRLVGSAESPRPLDRIEIIVNGKVVRTVQPANKQTQRQGFHSSIDESIRLDGSSWVVVRCFQKQPDGRIRFAHTNPFHFEIAGKPLRPRKEETAYLVKRIKDELVRHRGVLPDAALAEFEKALRIYAKLHEKAR